MSACLCLQELVNVRQGIFDTTDQRVEYVKSIAQNMIMVLRSPAKQLFLLKEKLIFKEFIRIPQKFEVSLASLNLYR